MGYPQPAGATSGHRASDSPAGPRVGDTMTTSEPPENRPTPPAGSDHTSSETPASDHPAPEHAMASESPTEQIDPSGAGHRTGDPADPATDPAAGHRADPVADPAGGQ